MGQRALSPDPIAFVPKAVHILRIRAPDGYGTVLLQHRSWSLWLLAHTHLRPNLPGNGAAKHLVARAIDKWATLERQPQLLLPPEEIYIRLQQFVSRIWPSI